MGKNHRKQITARQDGKVVIKFLWWPLIISIVISILLTLLLNILF